MATLVGLETDDGDAEERPAEKNSRGSPFAASIGHHGVMRCGARWMMIVLLDGAVATAGACTRENPGFDGSGDGTAVASSSSSDQGEVAEDTNRPSTTGPDEASGGTTRVDDTSTTAVSETAEGTTGEPVCTPHPNDLIEFTVHDGKGAFILPSCGLTHVTELGSISVEGNSISHQVCADCTCMMEEGQARTLDFGESLSPPIMPANCGVLAYWADPVPNDAGTCAWRGFAVFTDGAAPRYVGSNSRFLPETIFGIVPVGLSAEDEQCPNDPSGGCMLGPHGLTFGRSRPVFVGNPREVVIPFAASQSYLVTNRMASVAPECREQVSWTALVQR
jgi:hypothetical protein